jgi:hypothetical protein
MPRTPTAELIRELRGVLRHVPHAPRRSDILEHIDHSEQTFKRRFGSLQEALETADIPTYNLGCIVPLESLLDDVQRIAAIVERTPYSTDIEAHGEYDLRTYINRCGDTWNDVLEAAGFDPIPPEKDIPRDALIGELERLYEEFDQPPSRWTMRFYGQYSTAPYDREFGSWNTALEAADIPRERYQISTDELEAELQQVADKAGRPPTERDIDRYAAYSASTYYRRFGTLESARAAAGIDNQASSTDKTLPNE